MALWLSAFRKGIDEDLDLNRGNVGMIRDL